MDLLLVEPDPPVAAFSPTMEELRACHPDDGVVLAEHDDDYPNSSNVVEAYPGRLREKVDRPFGTRSIETVRGLGCRLVGAPLTPGSRLPAR